MLNTTAVAFVMLVAAVVVLSAGPASAALITDETPAGPNHGQNLNTSDTLGLSGETAITHTYLATGGVLSSPLYVYNWADTNGSGAGTPTATPNLNLGSLKIYSTAVPVNREFRLAVGGVNGDIIGDSGVTAFDLKYRLSTNNNGDRGYLKLSYVRDVTIGAIYNICDEGYGYYRFVVANAVIIGEATGSGGGPARNISVDSITTTSTGLWSRGVSIYSVGDVKIQNRNNSVLGNIDASALIGEAAVAIRHDGQFLAYDIKTCSTGVNDSSTSGSVTLNGNYDATDGIASGDTCTVHDIDAHSTKLGSSSISVNGYAGVTLNAVRTDAPTGQTGSLNIGNTSSIQGDITITGAINLDNTAATANEGDLSLLATGRIGIASLDFGKVRYAKFSSPLFSLIAGAITSLSTTSSGGTGTEADPKVLTQVDLRVPNGQKLYYKAASNAGLGGLTYKVSDLADGTAGQGGLLLPYTAGTALAAVDAGTGYELAPVDDTVQLNGTITNAATAGTILAWQWDLDGNQTTAEFAIQNPTLTSAAAAALGWTAGNTYAISARAMNDMGWGSWANSSVLFQTSVTASVLPATADDRGDAGVFDTAVSLDAVGTGNALTGWGTMVTPQTTGYTDTDADPGVQMHWDGGDRYGYAKFLAGASSSNPTMAWRSHLPGEKDTHNRSLISDVMQLADLTLTSAYTVLQMEYDEDDAAIVGNEEDLIDARKIYMVYKSGGVWVPAVDLATGTLYEAAYTGQTTVVGDWGVYADGEHHYVWAVLDGTLVGNDFAIVPEPATLGFLALGGLSMLGAAIRRRREA